MRVAAYARFSDDVQNPRSIADQVSLCRAYAERQGWTPAVRGFSDAAISGAAKANRPGLIAALEAAAAGEFDILLAEDEDRIARNLEDLAHVWNRLEDAGVQLWTIASGRVELMHVALKGYGAQDFLRNLSAKTRRGMHANAEAGLATGAKVYGYRSRPGGQTAIVEDEAQVVREIFAAYARGDSLRTITADLNARGVPGPSGGRWAPSTITGSRQRGNGILRQGLYAGDKVWNRVAMSKDRTTGKRISTPRPAAEWKHTPVPHLRLVDQPTWDAVQARLTAAGDSAPHQRRPAPQRIFSGLLRCAACGAAMTTFNGRGRLICAARRAHGPVGCANARSVDRADVEQRVLEGLRTRLLHPQAVRAYVRAYHARWQARAAAVAQQTAPLERQLAELERRIGRLLDEIEAQGGSPRLRERLATREAERADLVRQLAEATTAAGAPRALTLHPRLPDVFARRVAEIQAHLTTHGARAHAGDAASAATIAALRQMIVGIDVANHGPGLEGRDAVSVVLRGALATFLEAAHDEGGAPAGGPASPAVRRLNNVVAGASYKLDQTVPVIEIAC